MLDSQLFQNQHKISESDIKFYLATLPSIELKKQIRLKIYHRKRKVIQGINKTTNVEVLEVVTPHFANHLLSAFWRPAAMIISAHFIIN
jgi:hypothetical protein